MSSKTIPTATKEEATPALTPKLRFPEFRGVEGWYQDKLGYVCDLYQPVTLSASELSMTGEYLVYGANGVIGSHNEYNHEESEIAVTCRGATCGEVTITKPKSWITGNSMVVKPKTTKLNKDFIFQYLKNHGLKSVISGSAQPQITRSGFSLLKVLIPSPAEQQKIAECLSSVDELIAAQTRKLEALKTHKKGLMQQLFPREGETQPRLRFPEFQDAGEWEQQPLGVVAEFVSERINLERVGLANYISTENILPDYGGVMRASKLPSTDSVTRFKPNDTLVSNIRPYLKKVWFSSKDGGVSNDVIVIRAKQKLNAHYMSFLLKNDSFIEYVMDGAKGVKMPRGDIDSMKKYPLFFPLKPEQQRIADCLSSLDDLITAHTQKHAALLRHKRGLMQQLFPSPEEIKA